MCHLHCFQRIILPLKGSFFSLSHEKVNDTNSEFHAFALSASTASGVTQITAGTKASRVRVDSVS